MTTDNDLTHRIIGCAMEAHYRLGPGLLESIYEECLCHELAQAGILYVRQHRLPIHRAVAASGDDARTRGGGIAYLLHLWAEHAFRPRP